MPRRHQGKLTKKGETMLRNPWRNPQEAPPDNSNPQPVERRTLTIKETAASPGINDWMVFENGQTGRHPGPPNRQEDPGTHQRPGPVRKRKPVPEQPITDTRTTNYQVTKHCADNPRSKHGIVPAGHHLPNQAATIVDLRRHGAQALPPLGQGTRHVPR